ncbi:hypothetical protein D9M69_403080 [compost metagenome]
MEVATGDHVTLLGEYQRVVGNRVGLDLQHFRGLAQLGQAGAHDLRLATQGVRVLDLVALRVGLGDLAAGCEQVAVGGSGVDLAALATGGVDARIERRTGTQHGFDAQAAADGGGGEQVFGLEQTTQGVGSGHLGAVEQGQALLGGQGHRLQAGDGQGFGGRQPLALVARLALTEQDQGHVRQRCQVAGGAHRALQRDVRVDLGVDQRHQGVDHLAADAGEATGQAVHLEQHDQAHHGVIQRLADTGGVGQHQRTLQFLQVGRGDAGRGQQAETGVDAVGGTPLGDDVLDAGDAGIDRLAGTGVQGQLQGLLVRLAQVCQGQLAGFQVQIHQGSPWPVFGPVRRHPLAACV